MKREVEMDGLEEDQSASTFGEPSELGPGAKTETLSSSENLVENHDGLILHHMTCIGL